MTVFEQLPKPYRWYNGSETTSIVDSAGNVYFADNAYNDAVPDSDPEHFRFMIFRYGVDGTIKRLQLEDDPTHFAGRGAVQLSLRNGSGYYTAGMVNGKKCRGPIPEFVPFPSIGAIMELIQSLQAQINELATKDLLQQRSIGNLSQTINELQTQLGNVSGGNLDPRDRQALDLLRAGTDATLIP